MKSSPGTRFEQLCRSLRSVRADFNAYRQESFELAVRLRDGLREYLDAPEGYVSLFANRGDFAGRKMDSPAGAMKLEDDAYWHFGIAIDLCEEPETMPFHCVAFDLRLKRTDEGYVLHVDSGAQFDLRGEDAGRLDAFFEHIFGHVTQRYQNAFDEFLTRGDPSRRFGF